MRSHARAFRTANRNLAFALVCTALLATCTLNPPLEAQTPPAAPPCSANSVLLTAKPIYGVGLTTIRNACPAFLTALNAWYKANPFATVADALNALNGPPPPVVVPPVVTPPPVLQSPPTTADPSLGAHYYDNFSTYTTSAQVNSASLLPGYLWYGPNHDYGGSGTSGVSYDPVEKAMRYDWPARPTAACSGAELTNARMLRLYPPPTGLKDIWVRFTSKESPNFEHGRTGCGGRSYKFFLIGFNNANVGARVGTYLFDAGQAASVAAIPTRLYMDANSMGAKGGLQIGGDSSWGGQYHTWVLGVEGIGTSTASFSVYLDGNLIHTLTGPFLLGQTLGNGWAVTFELGANINSGPDHAQSRWWKEFGVYSSKPSLAPLVIK